MSPWRSSSYSHSFKRKQCSRMRPPLRPGPRRIRTALVHQSPVRLRVHPRCATGLTLRKMRTTMIHPGIRACPTEGRYVSPPGLEFFVFFPKYFVFSAPLTHTPFPPISHAGASLSANACRESPAGPPLWLPVARRALLWRRAGHGHRSSRRWSPRRPWQDAPKERQWRLWPARQRTRLRARRPVRGCPR